ncbi:class I SAM-dependent methyltransferase [Calidifontibacter sp. DB0510]|uniref:Class I SAM-dependent methyltransferase n=1 Tax=Metallococcus carri TaxID=1656884 RepID=A0A967EA75_9MICO|nr:class I SAM-dependent methyltransferase [Metallococcus carri]NHN57167.1 class I SAM-dependent methyltransferase [Metallococcus carri]NOP38030.1 class I SAM-dependent methyltransferase [Calidifontibacter sp. DB2511S]
MITVDFDRFPVEPGMRLVDVGCGQGRHSFEAFRRGAHVVAFDQSESDLADVKSMFAAMELEGQQGPGATAEVRHGDARAMPFTDGEFDRVIASEILEHIHEDEQVIAELFRITRPGGLVAVTVPRNWPERVCWALSDEYHEVEGGHIRIYRASDLVDKLTRAGFEPYGRHHAHALHSPYWWLKCAVGTERDAAPVRAYHRLLVWDMLKAPFATRFAENALNPVLGKSFVVYLRKPEQAA